METQQDDVVAQTVTEAFLDGPDSSKIPNSIHSTTGAKEYGYSAPLVGGVTVFSWSIPAILKILGEEWLDFGWAEISLVRPVFPGNKITTRIIKGSSNSYYNLKMSNEKELYCVIGTVGLGKAPWLSELVKPSFQLQPSNYNKPRLTMDNACIGKDIYSRMVSISAEKSAFFSRELARDDSSMWTSGEHPVIHPGWIASQMTILLEHTYRHLPAIHTNTRLQNLRRAKAGQQLIVRGHLLNVFEKKRNQYVQVDGLITTEDGQELAQLRHTTIFKIRSPM